MLIYVHEYETATQKTYFLVFDLSIRRYHTFCLITHTRITPYKPISICYKNENGVIVAKDARFRTILFQTTNLQEFKDYINTYNVVQGV